MASRMAKVGIAVLILVIAIAVLVGTNLSRDSFKPSEAPDFTLPTLTGGNITLSQLAGTPVVLNFWTTWCPGCRTELPLLDAVAQQSRGEIKVVAINVGQRASTVQQFFRDYQPTMIIALDGNAEAFRDYCQKYGNPGRIPFTLFVDSEGIVRHARIGPFPSEAELWNTLHDVLGIAIP